MDAIPVRTAPGRRIVRDIDAPFRHFGEAELAVRVDKISRYSSGLVEAKTPAAFPRPAPVDLPTVAFLRLCSQALFPHQLGRLFRGRTRAFYAFLKYAKVLEAGRRHRRGALLNSAGHWAAR
jgi:hypothetical protein